MEPMQIQNELAGQVAQLLAEPFAQQNHMGEATLETIERTFEEIDELLSAGTPPEGWEHLSASFERCRALFCQLLMSIEMLGWGTLMTDTLGNLHLRLGGAPIQAAPPQPAHPIPPAPAPAAPHTPNQSTSQEFEDILSSQPEENKNWAWEAEDPANPPSEFLLENNPEMPGPDDPTVLREVPQNPPATNLWSVEEEPETKTDVEVAAPQWEATEPPEAFETPAPPPAPETLDVSTANPLADLADSAPPPPEAVQGNVPPAPAPLLEKDRNPVAPTPPAGNAEDPLPVPPPQQADFAPPPPAPEIPQPQETAPPTQAEVELVPPPPATPPVEEVAQEPPLSSSRALPGEPLPAPRMMDIGELAGGAPAEETEIPATENIADLPPADQTEVTVPEQPAAEDHSSVADFFHQLGVQGTAPFSLEAGNRYQAIAQIFALEKALGQILEKPLAQFEAKRRTVLEPLAESTHGTVTETLATLAQAHPDWVPEGGVPLHAISHALTFLGTAPKLTGFSPAVLEAGVLLFFAGQEAQYGEWTGHNHLQVGGLGPDELGELLFRCMRVQAHRSHVLNPSRSVAGTNPVTADFERLMELIHRLEPLSKAA